MPYLKNIFREGTRNLNVACHEKAYKLKRYSGIVFSGSKLCKLIQNISCNKAGEVTRMWRPRNIENIKFRIKKQWN